MLKDSTFLLRPFTYNDVASLTHFANNPRIAENLMDRFPYPYKKENATSFISSIIHDNPVQVFAIEVENKAAGAIGLLVQDDIYCKNAELGYWLAEPFWNRGIVTEAIKQMVDYGFRTFAINRIFARPFGRNEASQRALEKAGFQMEYKLPKALYKNGVYEDEVCFSIRKVE